MECRIEAINDLHILGALIISTSRSPLSLFSLSHLLPFFLMRFSLHIRLNSLLHFPSPPPLKHWVTQSWTPAAAREPVCSLRCRPLGPPFLDGSSPIPCPESRQLCLQYVWPVLSFYLFFKNSARAQSNPGNKAQSSKPQRWTGGQLPAPPPTAQTRF